MDVLSARRSHARRGSFGRRTAATVVERIRSWRLPSHRGSPVHGVADVARRFDVTRVSRSTTGDRRRGAGSLQASVRRRGSFEVIGAAAGEAVLPAAAPEPSPTEGVHGGDCGHAGRRSFACRSSPPTTDLTPADPRRGGGMIGPGAGVRVYLACGVTDMRKGIAGLAALAQQALRQNPASGAVFAFRGRRGDRIKLLAGTVRVSASTTRCWRRDVFPGHLPPKGRRG